MADVPSRATVDAELDLISGSLTAFTEKHGGVFVVVYVDREGGVHEAANANDKVRKGIGDYLSEPMGDPEQRVTGGSN